MKYLVFVIIVFFAGCNTSETTIANNQSVNKESPSITNEDIEPNTKKSYPPELSYLEDLYQPKNCAFGYYGNNNSICQDSKGNIDNPYLLNIMDPTNMEPIVPTSFLHEEIRLSIFNTIIHGTQYNKDIWCQDAYEQTLNLNSYAYNTLGQNNYIRNQISKESFNAKFYQEGNTTHVVLIKPSINSLNQHYIAHQSYDDTSKSIWTNESLAWTAITYNPDLYDYSFAVMENDDICLKKESSIYCKNKSTNEPFVLTRQYGSNSPHKDFVLDDGKLSQISSYPIHDQGILRVAFEPDEDTYYTSGIETPYTFTLEDATTERNESICQPLQFYTEFGKLFRSISPLFINGSWDKESFLVSTGANDEAYTEELIGPFGYIKDLYSYNTLTCKNDLWKITPILMNGNQYLSYPSGIEAFIQYSADSAHKNINSKLYENNINENNTFYTFIDNNGIVEGIQNKSITPELEEKIVTARGYFYEELTHYLTTDYKLHILSRVNRCGNITANYVNSSYENTGYLVEGTMKSYVYHYILDLTKDNYLEPIREEFLGEFEW